MKEILKISNTPLPAGPYSTAVKTGNLIFFSGQIAPSVTGDNPTASQTKQILDNIKMILEPLGLNMSNIVKSTVFLTDLKQFDEMNKVYSTYFDNNPPARSTIEVNALPKGALVEIEIIVETTH